MCLPVTQMITIQLFLLIQKIQLKSLKPKSSINSRKRFQIRLLCVNNKTEIVFG